MWEGRARKRQGRREGCRGTGVGGSLGTQCMPAGTLPTRSPWKAQVKGGNLKNWWGLEGLVFGVGRGWGQVV